MYGLGQHKTFTDYVEMINQEDPVLIYGMTIAAAKRIEKMYGKESKSSNIKTDITGVTGVRSSPTIPLIESKGKCDGFNYMAMFLKEWGASKEQINEAREKIKTGEIKVSQNDYSWLTSETLMDPNFNIKEVFKMMNDDIKNSMNIKVSLATRRARKE